MVCWSRAFLFLETQERRDFLFTGEERSDCSPCPDASGNKKARLTLLDCGIEEIAAQDSLRHFSAGVWTSEKRLLSCLRLLMQLLQRLLNDASSSSWFDAAVGL